jgi:hypothetical protein
LKIAYADDKHKTAQRTLIPSVRRGRMAWRGRSKEPAVDRDKLDYWVSCAERIKESAAGQDAPLVVRPYVSDPTLAEAIIAREHIVISHIVDAELGDMSIAWIEPSGNTDGRRPGTRISMGDTDFEAAMLCYVSACFGDALPIYTEHPAPDPGSPLN